MSNIETITCPNGTVWFYSDETGEYRDADGERGYYCERCDNIVHESEHAGDCCYTCAGR